MTYRFLNHTYLPLIMTKSNVEKCRTSSDPKFHRSLFLSVPLLIPGTSALSSPAGSCEKSTALMLQPGLALQLHTMPVVIVDNGGLDMPH